MNAFGFLNFSIPTFSVLLISNLNVYSNGFLTYKSILQYLVVDLLLRSITH